MEQNPYPPTTSRTQGSSSSGSAVSFDGGGGLDRPLAENARDQVQKVASVVKDRATTAASERKDAAALEVDRVVGALRQTGDNLCRNDADGLGRVVSGAADRLQGVQRYLETRDVGTMLKDAQTLGRRHPLALIGGALVAGIVLGRVLRAGKRDDELDVVFEPEPGLLEDRPSSPPLGGLA